MDNQRLIHRILSERYELQEMLDADDTARPPSALGDAAGGSLVRTFRAQDRALGRSVVVKVLHDFAQQSAPDVREAFFDGLRQVIALGHVHIARVFDVGEDDGLRYLVEEDVAGSITLAQRIRRLAPFSISVATDTALAVAQALKFAHSRGVTHGALRPQEVVVGESGQILVTGFGLNKAREALTNVSLFGGAANPQRAAYLQTLLPYRPVTEDPTRPASASTDIYSLGVLLYEMLTGERPPRTAVTAQTEELASPATINRGVPRALEGVVQKALATTGGATESASVATQNDRYGSISEMLADLVAIQDALRFGKSLAWSPLDSSVESSGDAGNEADDLDLLPVPPAVLNRMNERAAGPSGVGAGGKRPPPPPVVPTTSSLPPGNAPTIPTGRREKERVVQYSANRWLTFINLLLGLVLLGGIGFFGWMAVNFTKPAVEVVVPNLIGKPVGQAEQLARTLNFTLAKVEEQYRDKEPRDQIYQMRPEPGRRIREGKPVSIWISKGPRLVEVPDVRDVSFDRARKLIEKAGLRLGTYPKEFDAIVPKGNIIRQSPDGAELRRRGDKVNLVVSKGEEPQEIPAVVDTPLPGDVVEPPANEVAPPLPEDGGDGGEDPGKKDDKAGRVRIFEARYVVPSDDAMHMIRIDVSDKNGVRTIYNKERRAGETVREDVEAYGTKITIRLFDNDALVKTNYGKSTGNE